MQVKICGIKRMEEVEILNRYPVDYAGFIFAASKRQVTPEQAGVLIARLRPGITPVGVFVDESPQRVNDLVRECGLEVVQLHGRESVEDIRRIKARVWKTIPVDVEDPSSLEILESWEAALPKLPNLEGLLLDARVGGQSGGTGKAFPWSWAAGLEERFPLFLAGGLCPENIREAIRTLHPALVDVNSGVETDLLKDEEKIRRLFEEIDKEEKDR
ncbi:phosphoribosylanthranilate isomerase [Anaerotalea alkaliphila]|uniref:N-(5'-phosphoribosyl)anthranilate isomerase n=1 Tax=Anaerotalea alkaliphila TaxID=2662126 RepID=A0A7X5HW35_9FIRM|nr:phosphoribosylanthranilate isomerase [Anaerotalea alkaliphila]NDL67725.1 phosphoribosylanthranilate isomerase [Anaerotalea alkaliphila]